MTKYRVNFPAPADPSRLNEMELEVGDNVYHQGDVFELPADWILDKDPFEPRGLRFQVPHIRVNDKDEIIKDYLAVILPVSPYVEGAPEPETPDETPPEPPAPKVKKPVQVKIPKGG